MLSGLSFSRYLKRFSYKSGVNEIDDHCCNDATIWIYFLGQGFVQGPSFAEIPVEFSLVKKKRTGVFYPNPTSTPKVPSNRALMALNRGYVGYNSPSPKP